jgi:hypothetical protein
LPSSEVAPPEPAGSLRISARETKAVNPINPVQTMK